MCGSYRICFKDTKIGLSILDEAAKLNINEFAMDDVYPGSDVLTIVPKENKVTLDVKRWGIPLNKKKLINARIESLNDKPFYADIKNNRCVIPVTSFYEWNDSKRYEVQHSEEDLVYLAGIYNDKGEMLILTGCSENELAKLHDRSPVILKKDEMLSYLSNRLDPFIDNVNIKITESKI